MGGFSLGFSTGQAPNPSLPPPPYETVAPMVSSSAMGARIARAREAMEMSQTELGKRVGLSQTAVSKTELGKTVPTDSHLAALAHALGVSVAWLRDGKGRGPAEGPPERAPTVPPTTGGASGVRVSEGASKAILEALDAALEEAFDRARGHRFADRDAIHRAFAADFSEGLRVTLPVHPEELLRAARRLLDTAAAIRNEGREFSLSEAVMRVASG